MYPARHAAKRGIQAVEQIVGDGRGNLRGVPERKAVLASRDPGNTTSERKKHPG
jgi:hypothetical protein